MQDNFTSLKYCGMSAEWQNYEARRAVARQRLRKRNNEVWEAVFSTRSVLRHATVDKLLGEAFSVELVPRLHNMGQLPLVALRVVGGDEKEIQCLGV
jgi:hypothetical protein